MSMGCAYAIVAYGGEQVALRRAVEGALDEVDRIDRLMSHYRPASPLSRVNREAGLGPVSADPELLGLVAEALRYSRESGGAFDVTVGPLMKAWGFFRGGGRVPGEAELDEVLGRVGWQHVLLDERAATIRFARPGLELDLGGIAKGYAVDRAVAVLVRAGVPAALISAGGSTLFGLGTPPGREGWEVEVEDPLHADRVAFRAVLKDQALSVSGGANKSFERDGVTYSHLMDPRRGRPVQGVLGAAVLAPSGAAGDALDNAFPVLGVEGARSYIGTLPGIEAFLFLSDGAGGWTSVHLRGPARPR